MRKLGKILHANEQSLVARADWAPSLGARVQNRASSPIGRVSDVFGPIGSPYVAIRPVRGLNSGKITELEGRDVFIERSESRGWKQR